MKGVSPAASGLPAGDYSRFVYPALVDSLYKTAFGRPADEGGLAASVARLQAGTPLEILAEDFVRSDEFLARHGSGEAVDAAYLTALYRDGLGRDPESDGLAHWLAKAEKGVTRAGVLAAFAASNEALSKVVLQRAPASAIESGDQSHPLRVNSLYKAAFGRFADEAGLAANVERLRSGTTLEGLADGLVRSAEFHARYGSSQSVDLKYITALYGNTLERQPELEELAFWLGQGERGATRARVLAAIAGSDKAVNRLFATKLDETATYHGWIRNYDTITDADRSAIRAHLASLPYRPVISVIIPTVRVPESALRESWLSIKRQLYPNWELCVAADKAAETLLEAVFGVSPPVDPRVRFARSAPFPGVVEMVNVALESATGEFVTFLRAGDALAEHALYEVAFALGANSRTDVLYGDRDEVTPSGQRHDPWFKPGWDPDLLLAHDYLSDFAVYRRDLVMAVGSLRPGFEGAEFYDLALRAAAATGPDCITHVPAILCHKRYTDEASDPETALRSLRAIDASRRAVREHLDGRGEKGAAVKPAPQIPGANRIVWPLPAPEPLVSVIIPTRDRADLVAECINGLLHQTDYRNLELLIVDNNSVEPATLALFDRLGREESAVRILHHPGPFNYPALNNAAAKEAKGEVLLLLNNDIKVIEPDWLRELVSQALRPDVGVAGAKLLYANGRLQHGGIVLGPEGQITHVHRLADRNQPGYFGQLALARTLSAVTGACAAIRRSVFVEVGGLDEVNLPVAFNDVDLCLRVANHGYRVVWTPFAELFHLESASRGQDGADSATRTRFLQELKYMHQTWGTLLESADPFHNPNLRFAWEYFQVPSPPRREKPWRPFFLEAFALKRHFSPPQGVSG